MEYREYKPAPGLEDCIRCFWTLHSNGVDPQPVLPDGSPEIVLNLADPFRRRDRRGRWDRQPLEILAGQLTSPVVIQPTGCVNLIGIRFKPAGLHSILAAPLHEFGNDQVDLGFVSRSLRHALHEAAGRGVDQIQRKLLQFRRKNPDPTMATLVETIFRRRGNTRISDLTALGRFGSRQVERRFDEEIGIGPKLLARIVRFQHALQVARRGETWALTAAECGYSDQAHMIRDFVQFAGASPEAFCRRRHEMSDRFTMSDFFNTNANPGDSVPADSFLRKTS